MCIRDLKNATKLKGNSLHLAKIQGTWWQLQDKRLQDICPAYDPDSLTNTIGVSEQYTVSNQIYFKPHPPNLRCPGHHNGVGDSGGQSDQ